MTHFRDTQVNPWLEGVDTFRVLAIVGVVAIHTTPVLDMAARRDGRFELSVVFVNQLARFAVPSLIGRSREETCLVAWLIRSWSG